MPTQTDPPPTLRRRVAVLVAGTLLLGLLAAPATPAGADTASAPSPATGATVSSTASGAYVLRVEHGATSDEPANGSAERPFPTIGSAIAFGQWLRRYGVPAHVLVAPGTYRENLTVGATGTNPAPLVIESEVPGAAIVTGADVEDRWTPLDAAGRTTAPWDQDWGPAAVPGGWSGVNVPDGIRRREAVFIDGTPAVQVLSEDALVPNSFYVDEAGDRLVLHPPAGVTDLADHDVEVARRQHALRIKGLARSVAVKGFVFENAAAPLEKYMAYVTDSTDVLIEGNAFRNSSWGGLGVCCTTGVTVRGNYVVDNGGNGIDTYRTRNAVIEGNFIARNNVRGARHGYTGWSVAGSKNLRLADAVFRGNVYQGNLARGLWLDTSITNVVVDGDRSCGNLGDGLYIEAVQGPLTIQDATFCGNARSGIAFGTSGDVTIQGSTLSDNAYGQLVFTGQRLRTWVDHVTGALVEMGDFADVSLTGNTFASSGTARLVYSPVIPLADWIGLLDAGEITASGNTWTRPSLDGAIRIQGSDYPLADWAAATGDIPSPPT